MIERISIKPGIYPGVPFCTYLQWEAVNNTFLTILQTRSPAHAVYYRDHPQPPTLALEQGKILHALSLEPGTFYDKYIVAPKVDKRTKAGKERWAEFVEQSGEKVVVVADDFRLAKIMSEAIQKHPAAKIFLAEGTPEVCMVWFDKKTGILCKARLDYYHRLFNMVIDLKSTRDASEGAFSRAISTYNYHQQAAFYSDGAATLMEEIQHFLYIAAEKTPPYAVACYQLNDDSIEAGRRAYRRALHKCKQCMDADKWPAYSEDPEMIDIPSYALSKEGVSGRYEL